jgi:hypothetical protein
MSKSHTCQAPIRQGEKKGELCGKLTETKYCIKHKRQEIIDKATEQNKRYCDIERGCFTILEDHQNKCTHCLKKAQIRDRKREDKKRQDPTLCLDCGNTLTAESRSKGKHDKPLRRCIPCYEKLKRIESQRPPRERNYKAEAYVNKNVIWNHYVKGAKKRNIDFSISKTIFNELIIQKCFYCDYYKDSEVNGVDRIDNNKGYIYENVVSCCESCNIIKGSQHPQEFIDKLYSINNYTVKKIPIDSLTIEKWKTTYLSKSVVNYTSYLKGANSRNIEFKLSEDKFKSIVSQPCYLCGLESSDINRNGIDRFDNMKGYLVENSKPCCGHCNLLKKNLLYSDIIIRANNISNKYEELSRFFSSKNIASRLSKIEPRIKSDNLIGEHTTCKTYKPFNEVIIIKSDIPDEIKEILKNPDIKTAIPIKQWKVKQIYEAITTNNENTYKEYCEQNNDITKLPNWESDWISFVGSVKGKTQKESEKPIRYFVENLRRIRHNELCYNKNNKLLDRDDRQQWPAITVVRAFLDGKLDTFKEFTENNTGDKPDDPVWQKRWNSFVSSLEENKDNEDTLKKLCSKFMTSQRTKKYRRNRI